MALIIKHNGQDITSKINLASGILTDRYGGVLDTLTLSFPEGETDLAFYRYDEIEVVNDAYKSGVMYVDECIFSSGHYQINAISFKPQNKKKSSGFWRHIDLFRIANDVAKANGLILKTYGVTNFRYDAVTRINETDLAFLDRICKREGYSIKCDNGQLILFSERALESEARAVTINQSEVEPNYFFKRSTNGVSSLTVKYFDISTNEYIEYTAIDNDVEGGTERITERVKDTEEAQRFALGYLRERNKYYLTAQIKVSLNTEISAGTVLQLKGFSEFDGKYVVDEVSHDIVNNKSYLKIRAVLNY